MSAASDVPAVEGAFSILRDTAAAVIEILCRAGWLRVPLAWIGRLTLPDYGMQSLIT